jgi:hypothetical protein
LILIVPTLQRGNQPKQSGVFLPGHGYRGHGPLLPQAPDFSARAGHARDVVFALGRSACAAYLVNKRWR